MRAITKVLIAASCLASALAGAAPGEPVQPANSRLQLKSATSSIAAGVSAAEKALTPQELAYLSYIYTGQMSCELGASVSIMPDETLPGAYRVQGKGFDYKMRLVNSRTGAIRLEDENKEAVWLQVAGKSMLMNQKLGRRMADDCKTPEQKAAADAAPPPSDADRLLR